MNEHLNLLTRQETIKLLRVSSASFDRLRKDDETFPKPKLVGKKPFWRLADIQTWAAA